MENSRPNTMGYVHLWLYSTPSVHIVWVFVEITCQSFPNDSKFKNGRPNKCNRAIYVHMEAWAEFNTKFAHQVHNRNVTRHLIGLRYFANQSNFA